MGGIAEECPGTPPQTRDALFIVYPVAHRLMISTPGANKGGIAPVLRLLTKGFLEIKR